MLEELLGILRGGHQGLIKLRFSRGLATLEQSLLLLRRAPGLPVWEEHRIDHFCGENLGFFLVKYSDGAH